MRKTKVFLSKIANLILLINESEDIFFEERPFLENTTLEPQIIPQDERRYENELKIQKTIEAIDSELAVELSKETHEPKQKRIFRMD